MSETANGLVEKIQDLGLSRNEQFKSLIKDAEGGQQAADAERQLSESVGDLPELLRNPRFLRACLRAKKYQVDKAMRVAVNYNSFRGRFSWHAAGESRSAVRASALEKELRSGFNMLLPDVDSHGHVVLTQCMSLLDLEKGSLESFQRAGYYLLHRALQRPEAQTSGIALVLDFRGFSWSLFMRIRLADFRRGVAMLQDCFPARLAAIYVLHQPQWLSSLGTLLRPLLRNDTLQQKIVLIGSDYSLLHSHVPADALPSTLNVRGNLAFDWNATIDSWMSEEADKLDFDPASLI